MRYGARMQRGLEAILERQARQLRLLGIAMVVLAAICGASAIYMVTLPSIAFMNRFYAFSGLIVFGGSGIAAIRRSRQVEVELAERRREPIPRAVVRTKPD